MAESNEFSLLAVMDRLWFHQTLFFTETASILCPENLENSPIKNTHIQTSLILEDISSVIFERTSPQDDDQEGGVAKQKETTHKERPTRSEFEARKIRSHSSSPYVDKRQKKSQWAKRYKSLGELELDEVKGFIDLGFIFEKEHTSKKMMSILPGLQRLEPIKTKPNRVSSRNSERTDEESGIARSYPYEAWLITKSKSPLMHRRMPRVSASADMKNRIRQWAKTVATVIRQES